MDNHVNKDTYVSIITSIVSVAASQAAGIASISAEAGSIAGKLNLKNRSRSIEVEITDNNQVIISLNANAYYGYQIPVLTCELQELIKKEVEKTTYFTVKSINVNIVGVVFPA